MLWTPGGSGPLRRHAAPPEVPEHARFAPRGLAAGEWTTLPPAYPIAVERLGMAEEETDAYKELLIGQLERWAAPAHQVLGHPQPIQSDMQLECQLAANGVYCGDRSSHSDPRRPALEPGATGWRLLLQLDSDDSAGMMWGDSGMLYFWIREADRRARGFDAAWMILQCS